MLVPSSCEGRLENVMAEAIGREQLVIPTFHSFNSLTHYFVPVDCRLASIWMTIH